VIKLESVKINNYSCKNLDLCCRVLQDTVLGPLLFIIFINDLLKINKSPNIEILSFAGIQLSYYRKKTINSLYYGADTI